MSEFKFEWIDRYDSLRRSDVFYCMGNNHNPVVDIKYDGRLIRIACDGEMNFDWNGVTVRNDNDLMSAGIFTDKDWLEVLDDNDFDALLPWFDAYEEIEGEFWVHLDMVYGDLNEIIKAVQRFILFPEDTDSRLVQEGIR